MEAGKKPPRALITGIAGQDGSYLAELLVAKGYEVHGTVRPGADPGHQRLRAIDSTISCDQTQLDDPDAVDELISRVAPDEVFNLAAPSVVGASWNDPFWTVGFMTRSVTALLEAIVRHAPQAHFVQATSSEIFRGSTESPQTEQTCPAARSPYGSGKLFGHSLAGVYREHHGLHTSSAILYNHESPRRPVEFVTRKVVNTAVRIKRGDANELVLGDLSARRDWGYAKDYVEAMWLMAQQPSGDDYVLATGELHSVEDLVKAVFERVGLDHREYVKSDPGLMRPSDGTVLVGNPAKARANLAWNATHDFGSLVDLMVDAELELTNSI